MTICEKLFEDIKGAEGVQRLIAEQMPDLVFRPLPAVPWLFLKGSEDLVLGAEVVPKELQYGAKRPVPYQFPHLKVYAEQGSIEGVRSAENGAYILSSDRERSIVQVRPCVANEAGSNSNSIRVSNYWEAILEIVYTPLARNIE